MRCTALRRGMYALVMLILAFATLPFPVLVVYSWFPDVYQYFGGPDFPYDAPRQAPCC
jgi:hypothetical protein